MHFCCRAPYGARGLKSADGRPVPAQPRRRAPYGARGLKFLVVTAGLGSGASRPVWGAWIEIWWRRSAPNGPWSRPVWGAWIEINQLDYIDRAARSRPVWGAWIEIIPGAAAAPPPTVAPRMGRVD